MFLTWEIELNYEIGGKAHKKDKYGLCWALKAKGQKLGLIISKK